MGHPPWHDSRCVAISYYMDDDDDDHDGDDDDDDCCPSPAARFHCVHCHPSSFSPFPRSTSIVMRKSRELDPCQPVGTASHGGGYLPTSLPPYTRP